MKLTEEAVDVYNQISERFDMHIPIMSTYGIRGSKPLPQAVAGSLSYEEIVSMYFYNPL